MSCIDDDRNSYFWCKTRLYGPKLRLTSSRRHEDAIAIGSGLFTARMVVVQTFFSSINSDRVYSLLGYKLWAKIFHKIEPDKPTVVRWYRRSMHDRNLEQVKVYEYLRSNLFFCVRICKSFVNRIGTRCIEGIDAIPVVFIFEKVTSWRLVELNHVPRVLVFNITCLRLQSRAPRELGTWSKCNLWAFPGCLRIYNISIKYECNINLDPLGKML